MIGLDTNVLVRYCVRDDPEQAAKATDIIEQGLSEHEFAYINLVVLVETVWVLQRVYRLTDQEIAAFLERMLQADRLRVENEQQVFEAMLAVKEGNGRFTDALIGTINAAAGCAHTATFDRKAGRLPGFAVI